MNILQSERLSLRHATYDDAPFIFELLTDQTFIDNIADKGIRDLEGAKGYIRDTLIASYDKNGFGLFMVETLESGESVGLCGLVKRDELDIPDVGYAFLPRYTGKGYATESAAAVMAWGRQTLGLTRIAGITIPGNQASINVLEKIGLHKEKVIDYHGEDTLLFLSK